MICTYCKKEIDEDSKYCKYCAMQVIKHPVCPKCKSKDLPQDAKFCPDCGYQLKIKSEIDIRKEAQYIVDKYPKGYRRFVFRGELPNFSSRVGVKNCEKIIAMEFIIAKTEKEIQIKGLSV